MSKLYYLASPYSKYPGGHEAAYKAICEQAAFLKANGIDVISPISHSHGIVGYIEPGSYGYDLMMNWDYNIIDHLDGVIICELDGWDKSYGVDLEIKYCMARNIPLWHMVPSEVPNLD